MFESIFRLISAGFAICCIAMIAALYLWAVDAPSQLSEQREMEWARFAIEVVFGIGLSGVLFHTVATMWRPVKNFLVRWHREWKALTDYDQRDTLAWQNIGLLPSEARQYLVLLLLDNSRTFYYRDRGEWRSLVDGYAVRRVKDSSDKRLYEITASIRQRRDDILQNRHQFIRCSWPPRE